MRQWGQIGALHCYGFYCLLVSYLFGATTSHQGARPRFSSPCRTRELPSYLALIGSGLDLVTVMPEGEFHVGKTHLHSQDKGGVRVAAQRGLVLTCRERETGQHRHNMVVFKREGDTGKPEWTQNGS